MFGLGTQRAGDGGLTMNSASPLLPEQWTVEVDDYPLDLRWSADGEWLAALPSHGRILVLDRLGKVKAALAGHPGGNGALAWHPQRAALATYGQDATVRVYEMGASVPRTMPIEVTLEKGWAERVAWNADGSMLAASTGRTVCVLDASTGVIDHRLCDHKSTVCDLAWNPKNARELATVCDGGAQIWRLGEAVPFGHFDWGGASLLVTWSPNGRWVVTGDQTPSVHLYDIGRKHPLHIQGYQHKVKALAWEGQGEWLATGGSASITLWPCTGKRGPEGAKPIQLFGHLKEIIALDFVRANSVLASGGRDGMVLLWMPHRSTEPALIAQRRAEITAVRWSPRGEALTFATADGELTLCGVAAGIKLP
jgi:WD40 repeat protein